MTIRRVNIGQEKGEPNLLDFIPPSKYTILPNTGGCYNARDAVYTLQVGARTAGRPPAVQAGSAGDEKILFPNMSETLKAAGQLVKDGFQVMVYCSDDPIQARMLEDLGCIAVMPLASLIGSGMGILNPWNLSLIIEQARVPGRRRCRCRHGVGRGHRHGTRLRRHPDEYRHAAAREPMSRMARAMKLAVQGGREAYLAGRMPRRAGVMSACPRRPWPG